MCKNTLDSRYFFVIGLSHIITTQLKMQISAYMEQRDENEFIHAILYQGNIIFYISWMMGFLVFVMTLKKGLYKFQFGLFAWTHIFILIYTFQKSLAMSNIFEGLVW